MDVRVPDSRVNGKEGALTQDAHARNVRPGTVSIWLYFWVGDGSLCGLSGVRVSHGDGASIWCPLWGTVGS